MLIPSPRFLGPASTGMTDDANKTFDECVEARSDVSNSGEDMEDCHPWETAIAQQLQIVSGKVSS